MNLERFPIDTQICRLEIGSCKLFFSNQLINLKRIRIFNHFFLKIYTVAFPNNHIVYNWNKKIDQKNKKAIHVASDMQMSQFDLAETIESSDNMTINNRKFK